MRASEPGAKTHIVQGGRVSRYGLRTFALGYLALILVIPVGLIFFKAFEDGFMHAVDSVTTPEAIHAFYLTIVLVLIAVPLNTIFGIACAIVLVRHRFRGKAILNALVDLPFAVSPIVIGLSLVLVYGSVDGWFGPWLAENGIKVIFSPAGHGAGDDLRLAAVRGSRGAAGSPGDRRRAGAGRERPWGPSGWQTFWRITLPSIRWGVTYGVVLGTARALGEFGAVSVVSGKIVGSTETATILRREPVRALQRRRRLRGGAGAGRARPDDPVRDEPGSAAGPKDRRAERGGGARPRNRRRSY